MPHCQKTVFQPSLPTAITVHLSRCPSVATYNPCREVCPQLWTLHRLPLVCSSPTHTTTHRSGHHQHSTESTISREKTSATTAFTMPLLKKGCDFGAKQLLRFKEVWPHNTDCNMRHPTVSNWYSCTATTQHAICQHLPKATVQDHASKTNTGYWQEPMYDSTSSGSCSSTATTPTIRLPYTRPIIRQMLLPPQHNWNTRHQRIRLYLYATNSAIAHKTTNRIDLTTNSNILSKCRHAMP